MGARLGGAIASPCVARTKDDDVQQAENARGHLVNCLQRAEALIATPDKLKTECAHHFKLAGLDGSGQMRRVELRRLLWTFAHHLGSTELSWEAIEAAAVAGTLAPEAAVVTEDEFFRCVLKTLHLIAAELRRRIAEITAWDIPVAAKEAGQPSFASSARAPADKQQGHAAILDGTWVSSTDEENIIDNSVLQWTDGDRSTIVETEPRTFATKFKGQACVARLSRDATRLVWNDGDIWMRRAELGAGRTGRTGAQPRPDVQPHASAEADPSQELHDALRALQDQMDALQGESSKTPPRQLPKLASPQGSPDEVEVVGEEVELVATVEQTEQELLFTPAPGGHPEDLAPINGMLVMVLSNEGGFDPQRLYISTGSLALTAPDAGLEPTLAQRLWCASGKSTFDLALLQSIICGEAVAKTPVARVLPQYVRHNMEATRRIMVLGFVTSEALCLWFSAEEDIELGHKAVLAEARSAGAAPHSIPEVHMTELGQLGQ